METNNKPRRIHPLVAGAAVSVMLVSLIGVAAITGIIPNSHSTITPATGVSNLASTNPAVDTSTLPSQTVPQALEKPATAPVKPAVKTYHPVTHRDDNRNTQPTRVASAPVCYDCGRVIAIDTIEKKPKTNGIGAAAGAVVGGLLGNQFGGGNGRTLATVAGAVGGGFAGDEVERRTRNGNTSYEVRVRMEDGEVRSFPYAAQPGWNVGDRVRVNNGTLSSRG